MTDMTEKEQKKYVDLALMFKNIQPSFKELLLSADLHADLQYALERINPKTVCPHVPNILNFARYRPLNEMHVVILGQDPYSNWTDAHGLCFSSLGACVPPSLIYVFECLKHNGFIQSDRPIKPDLSAWAESGVLMLNTTLTVEVGVKKANTHKPFWEKYMAKVIAKLAGLNQPIVWLLWGNDAKRYASLIRNNPKHLVLTEVHPSPMSQRGLEESKRFKYCRHFNLANDFLRTNGLPEINWNPEPEPHIVHTRGRISCDDADAAKQVISLEKEQKEDHILYTDGSSIGHGGEIEIGMTSIVNKVDRATSRAGYAALFVSGPLKGVKLMGRIGQGLSEERNVIIYPSMIRAEGTAIIAALEHITDPGKKINVEVVTDSEFWMSALKVWIPKWIKDDPDLSIEEVLVKHKNPDLTSKIWELYTNIIARGGSVNVRHIYSHVGEKKDYKPRPKKEALVRNTTAEDIKYNRLVDAWAGEARLLLNVGPLPPSQITLL